MNKETQVKAGNMEYIKFTSMCGNHELCMKPEFYEANPTIKDVTKTPLFTLFTDHNLTKFLHNPTGPAILVKKNGNKQYLINGIALNPDEIKKLEHSAQFNQNLTEIITDESK